jgi:phosphatidylinositol alpha-1,6-mannosyltransferase
MRRRRDLVLVTAGLGLGGGGRAVVGRLLARAGAQYARERGCGFRVLDLGDGAPAGLDGLSELPIRSFRGNRAALAAAVARAQLSGGRPRPALFFDLLGLARIQALLPAARRSPYGLTVYGIEIWRPLGWIRRRAFRGARAPLAISHAALARARPFLPAGGEGVEVLPLALEQRPPAGEVDHALLERLGRWAGAEPWALVVGRMGSSERYKGHDELLAAWPRVRSRTAARLMIAGGGDDRGRLEAAARAAGLEDAVLFTGFVSEATLDALYRRSSLLALPSRGEGFGLVYLEAMRAGKPCLALAGMAAAEIVVPGETGMLVPAGDLDALAAALSALLADPERARRMGEAGRERWRATFGYDRFRSRLETHLDRLTS